MKKTLSQLFALGLIAISSGVSMAQTYSATAGTGGTTEIQSDYSMATGDGASVSVDVPLEFELGKIVAIAVSPRGTSSLPANSYFDGIVPYASTHAPKILNLDPHPATGWGNMTNSLVHVTGGLYTNTPISLTISATDFLHESDPNSSFKSRNALSVGKTDSSGGNNKTYVYKYDDNVSSTTIFPLTESLDSTAVATEGGKFSWAYWSHAYIDTVDPTDRAGIYTSTATITISTL